VVRGAAALLGLALGALAYFLVAPSLPALHSLDAAIAVAATVGLGFVVALAAAPGPAVAAPFSLVPLVLGAALLVAVLDAARAGAAASPFEALLFGCAGVAFAARGRRGRDGPGARRCARRRRRRRRRATA
jgi:peptidoglycan/LPS O-acetylase OafA/YrhL